MTFALPPNELQRFAVLQKRQILDPLPKVAFDCEAD